MSDRIRLSHSIMWLLKQVFFHNNLVGKKSHKDIDVTKNDNSGGSKYTISENFRISVQFITLE